MYCLMASILFWNSFLAAFMLAIMAPMLPTIEAKIRTPTRKSRVTKAYLRIWRKGWPGSYSALLTGWGVSPMVVRVRVDQ